MLASNRFSRDKLIEILDATKDRTLGEVDKNNVFRKTITKPKITGIAGDVIEQSVLGYPPDGEQRPDLDIDGELTELKTTGMRKKEDNGKEYYEAKEPASITAVSIGTIEDETFFNSAFWHKIAHLLFVFYEYESDKTVLAAGYKDFHIRGYAFYSFKDDDLAVIKSDWQIIHDFLWNIREKYDGKTAKTKYPDLSTIINKQTVYLDTAPKYPNPPRFRLRRKVVSSIIEETLGKKQYEKLPDRYASYLDVIKKCSVLTQLYQGLSMSQLLSYFGVAIKPKASDPKQYAEQVIVRMFGGTSKSISQIEMFNRFGIIGKSIALTNKGGRTEDTKLLAVNFDELATDTIIDEETGEERPLRFEDSELYSYLNDNKFLFIVFREVPYENGKVKLGDNVFVGFKFVDLSTDEIMSAARETWNRVHRLVYYHELKSTVMRDKDGNIIYTPKTHVPMEEVNLPKSKELPIFCRGTGQNAKDKIVVNGIRLYRQNYWIKGLKLVEILKNTDDVPVSNSFKIKAERAEVLKSLKDPNL